VAGASNNKMLTSATRATVFIRILILFITFASFFYYVLCKL